MTNGTPLDLNQWSEKEKEVLVKYHLYFCYPLVSKFNSSFASAVYLFGSILLIWLLWNGLWLNSIILLINIVASVLISNKLNPRLFLHNAVERQNKLNLLDEMWAVDSVCEKIIGDLNKDKK
ncbi:hypothetical protein HY750_00315 [Candidatus Kuenenbacteria bacterium]|nr:hypothetical protein [Candidatus Kuenenbacteria bacterium]